MSWFVCEFVFVRETGGEEKSVCTREGVSLHGKESRGVCVGARGCVCMTTCLCVCECVSVCVIVRGIAHDNVGDPYRLETPGLHLRGGVPRLVERKTSNPRS